MKKLLILFAVFAISSVLRSQEEELLKHVPGNVDGFIYFSMKDLSVHPKFKEMSEVGQDPYFSQLKNDLGQAGIDIYDAVLSGVGFFNSKTQKTGGVVKSRLDEANFSKMIDSRPQDAAPMKKTAIDGKTYYIFERDNRKVAMVFLKSDIIGIADEIDGAGKLSALTDKDNILSNAKLMGYASKVDKKSPIWAVFELNISMPTPPKEEGNPIQPQQLFPLDNIQGGYLNINFSGESKDSLSLAACLNCKEKMKAQILTMQFQTFYVMYVPVLAKNNQSLSDQLAKALTFSNEDNNILIKAELTPALQDELGKLVEENKLDLNNIQIKAPAPKKKKKAQPNTAPETNPMPADPQPAKAQ